MKNRIGKLWYDLLVTLCKLWYGLLVTFRLRAAEYIVMTLTAK